VESEGWRLPIREREERVGNERRLFDQSTHSVCGPRDRAKDVCYLLGNAVNEGRGEEGGGLPRGEETAGQKTSEDSSTNQKRGI